MRGVGEEVGMEVGTTHLGNGLKNNPMPYYGPPTWNWVRQIRSDLS